MNKVFRSRHFRGLVQGVVVLVLVHVIGTLGYHWIGRPRATWIDSFYMTFITVATIGYGEVVDLTGHPLGRLFTVFIAVVGIAGFSYLFSTFVALLIESDLNAALRRRRMEKQIARLHVVARLHDLRNADKARRAGADEIVSPDFTGGMRIASAMIRPHVVNFMDQMLRSDEGLRVEEVAVPAGHPPTTVGELLPRSRDYILVATQELGRWVFNPPDGHAVQPGTVLVLMATPGGRAKVESAFARTN